MGVKGPRGTPKGGTSIYEGGRGKRRTFNRGWGGYMCRTFNGVRVRFLRVCGRMCILLCISDWRDS